MSEIVYDELFIIRFTWKTDELETVACLTNNGKGYTKEKAEQLACNMYIVSDVLKDAEILLYSKVKKENKK